MFTDIVKLGVKDIIKHRRIFCLFTILIISISIIMVSAILSILPDEETDNTTPVNYSVIPISYTTDTINTSNDLNNIYEIGGYSFFASSYLNERFNSDILVLLGQYEKNTNNNVIWCVPKDFNSDELGEIVKVLPEAIDDTVNGLDIIFEDEYQMLIKFNSMEYKHLIDYKLIGTELIYLIENTNFSDVDIENGLDISFEELFPNQSFSLYKNISSNKEEVYFIVYYVFLYVLMLILSLCVSFIIFIQNLYKKMHKEYMVHLTCGASKLSIFIRNSMFVVLLASVNFILINYLNGWSLNIIFCINIIITFIFIIVLESTTLRMLIKENLTTSLQGE